MTLKVFPVKYDIKNSSGRMTSDRCNHLPTLSVCTFEILTLKTFIML